MSDSTPVRLEELLAQREWVSRLARGLASDASAAADIEQETWLAAVRRPPRSGHSIRGWLATVARNVARQAHRGGERRAAREGAVAREGTSPSACDVVARAETQRRVAGAVLDLPEPYRTTLLLRYFEDLPVAEIAERTGTPRETVKTRITRGLARMKSRLDDRHGGSRSAWLVPLLATTESPPAGSVLLTKGILMAITARRVAIVAALILLSAVTWHLAAGFSPGAAPPPRPGPEMTGVRTGEEGPEEVAGGTATADPGTPAAPGDATAAGSPSGEPGGSRRARGGRVQATVESAETGRPLPGARVSVFVDGGEVASAVADRDGRILLQDVPGTFLGLAVGAPGHVRQAVSVAREPEDPIEVRFTLEKGRRLGGRVVGPDRRPVAGASVLAHSGGEGAPIGPGTEFEATGTDAEGNFALGTVPGSRSITLAVRAEGFEWARVPVTPDVIEAGRPVEVVLAPGGSVRGRVFRSDGTPVPGAAVYLLPGNAAGTAPPSLAVDLVWGGVASEGRDLTAADGSYLIPGLRFGREYGVLARTEAQGDSAAIPVVVTESAPVATRDLTLPEVGSLAVAVEGERLEGVRVRALRSPGAYDLRRAPSGSFEAPALPVGEYTVHVTANERMEHRRRVVIRSGESEAIRVRLERGEVLSGLVVDTAGRPVPGVMLQFSRMDQTEDAVDAPSASAETDAQGRFHMTDLARTSYLVNAYAPEHEGPVSRTVEVPAGDVKIVLRRDGAATVTLRARGAPPPEQVYLMIRSLDTGSGIGRSISWPDGPVTLENAGAGHSEIVVVADGFGRVVGPIDVGPGRTVDLGEIVLRPSVAASGTVLGPDGESAGGVTVEAGERWMPDHEVVKADAQGRFRLEEVASGRARIVVRAPDLPAQAFSVRTGPGAPAAVLALVPAARLAGRVIDANGNGVPNARVRHERIDGGPSGEGRAAVADVTGRFDKPLPAGRWRLSVVGDGRLLAEREVDLVSREGDAIEIRVESR